MLIKKILLIALAIGMPVFLMYLVLNQDAVDILLNELQKPKVLLAFFFSTVLLLLAHLVRALKTKYLTDTIKRSSWRTHYRALFIGYLFNDLLPFRLGEFFRAIVLGKGIKMSASFIFGLVIFDRAVDGIILGLIAFSLILFTPVFDSPLIHSVLITSAFLLVIIGAILTALVVLLVKQPPWFLRLWHRFTSLFNDNVRDSLRFKMWSAMYGLERVLRPKYLIRYMLLSCLMWAIYISALVPLAIVVTPDSSRQNTLAASTTSYLGVSAPSGPSHIGSYQTFVEPYIEANNNNESLRNLLALAWLLQVVPAFFVGLLFVLRTKETLERTKSSSKEELTQDKLLRNIDMTQDLGSFLDAFFTNNSLSRIMHRFEVDNSSKLVRYFKGGSSAVTALVHENNSFLVRKITPIQYKYKLESQYNWLKEKRSLKKIVNVIGQDTTNDYYKIDLEFNEDYQPFFDYIHSMPEKKSEKILTSVFDYLFKNVYSLPNPEYRPKDLSAYIEDRCLTKIRQASEVNDEIRGLLEHDTLVINGQEYLNIPIVLNKIRSNKATKKSLATYRKCSIHGDVTIDNILASKKANDFLLIDPTDNENEISGPVFDFGRMTQSLRYGYEFLCRDDQKVDIDQNVINFEYSLSKDYSKLHETLLVLQKKYLTPQEQSSVTFHAAILYSRMLTHRVVINPLNAAKFYAVSVIAFNNFFDEQNPDAK